MLLVTALDDIAWLLNLRGNDIQFNPVFFSYVILHTDDARSLFKVDLFIDSEKVSNIEDYLHQNSITVHNYLAISDKLIEYSETLDNKSIQIDSSQASFQLYDILDKHGF